MLRFLLKRTLCAVLTLFAVSVLTFLMFFALPRDPVSGMCPKNCDPQRLERVRQELGLRDPLIDQYANYLRGIVVGRDLGGAQGGRCDATVASSGRRDFAHWTRRSPERKANLAVDGLGAHLSLRLAR